MGITIQEALNCIKKQTKPYAHAVPPMPQSTFSHTVKAIERGDAKPATVKNFMSKFGYEVEREMLWRKNNGGI